MQTRVVAKTIVFDDADNILVLWRAADDAHRPGGFDFPGGNVDDGEAFSAGAVREVAEEAGLQLEASNLQLVFATAKVSFHTEVKAQTNIVWLGFIAKLPKGQTVKLSHEHQRFEWLPLQKALEVCDSPTQQMFLEHIRSNNLSVA